MLRQSRLVAMAAILFASVLSAPASAQFDILGGPSAGPSPDQVVTTSSKVKLSPDGQTGKLAITATIAPDWYIYSLTQKPGGPIKSKIVLETGTGFEVAGNFAPTEAPKQKKDPEAFDNLEIETHAGSVTWVADLRIAPGTDPSKLNIRGHLLSQACTTGSCLPPSPARFVAR